MKKEIMVTDINFSQNIIQNYFSIISCFRLLVFIRLDVNIIYRQMILSIIYNTYINQCLPWLLPETMAIGWDFGKAKCLV